MHHTIVIQTHICTYGVYTHLVRTAYAHAYRDLRIQVYVSIYASLFHHLINRQRRQYPCKEVPACIRTDGLPL
jgi:hypothetical protein